MTLGVILLFMDIRVLVLVCSYEIEVFERCHLPPQLEQKFKELVTPIYINIVHCVRTLTQWTNFTFPP